MACEEDTTKANSKEFTLPCSAVAWRTMPHPLPECTVALYVICGS